MLVRPDAAIRQLIIYLLAVSARRHARFIWVGHHRYLQMRYLAALSAQEDRLKDLRAELATAHAALDQAKRALAEYIRGLTV